jgi:hypothetical protein
MKPRMFAVTFDPTTDDGIEFHKIITEAPQLLEWSHYIAPTYVITTNATALEFENYIRSRWGNRLFFFVDVFPSTTRGGLLHKDAWEWIDKRK